MAVLNPSPPPPKRAQSPQTPEQSRMLRVPKRTLAPEGSLSAEPKRMPLSQGTSKATVGRNVSEMVRAGHPRNQAVAAAMRTRRTALARIAAGHRRAVLSQAKQGG